MQDILKSERGNIMKATVYLKKGEGRTIKAGGAWVYDNEIDRVEGAFENGDAAAASDSPTSRNQST